MAKIETYRTKENGFLIVLIKLVDDDKSLVFLLDPWKAGFRDFDIHNGSLKSLKREIGLPSLKFHKIEKIEAAKLLRQNYEIAKELDIEIPEDAKKWMEKLGVFKIEPEGSLYKCFNCQIHDITKDEVDEILKVAKKELKEGKVGTEDEEQYFYICENCKQEMHESHT